MRQLSKSSRVIEVLRHMFPGEWKYKYGKTIGVWQGPDFNVQRKDGKYFRSDTGAEVSWPELPARNHFMVNILHERLGGTWQLIKDHSRAEWESPDHDFTVYRGFTHSGYGRKPKAQRVLRRSDTKEIVYCSNGKRFYE